MGIPGVLIGNSRHCFDFLINPLAFWSKMKVLCFFNSKILNGDYDNFEQNWMFLSDRIFFAFKISKRLDMKYPPLFSYEKFNSNH